MDTHKKQSSGSGNEKGLKNAERNNVTGVKTSELRRDNDKPVTPISQESGKQDPKNQDPKNAEPRKHPANEDPTKHDPMHDTTESGPAKQDAAKPDKSKTATGGSKR